MYFQKYYKELDQEKIEKDIKEDGFDPDLFTNLPGFVYPLHQHPETKLLVFLKGSMDVVVGEKTFHCEPGDKLIIGPNVLHQAMVGDDGCEFYWSEKLR